MKLSVSEILPNPFKKQINGGKLDEDTVAKIRSNIQELGLMGALPVFKKDGRFYLVAGHHRLEALKREYGKEYKVEVAVHDYSQDNVLRGMVIENLSQRNGEFREETANLVLVRGYLQQHPETPVRLADKRDSLGRVNHDITPGSVRHISQWLDKNTGDVMKESKIADLLKIHDRLAPELQEKVDKKSHSSKLEEHSEVLGVKDASYIASIADHDEQIAIAKIVQDSNLNQPARIELIQKFKNLSEEQRQEVVSGETNILDLKNAGQEVLSSGEMSLRFNKRANELVIEMRDLRRTLSQFRRERLFEQFTPKQRESFRDRLLTVRTEYAALITELEESMVVLS